MAKKTRHGFPLVAKITSPIKVEDLGNGKNGIELFAFDAVDNSEVRSFNLLSNGWDLLHLAPFFTNLDVNFDRHGQWIDITHDFFDFSYYSINHFLIAFYFKD
jgi:hypothetical protein